MARFEVIETSLITNVRRYQVDAVSEQEARETYSDGEELESYETNSEVTDIRVVEEDRGRWPKYYDGPCAPEGFDPMDAGERWDDDY